jgi:hypothetical protein
LTAYFLGLSPQNTTKNSTKSILPPVLFFISAAVFKQTRFVLSRFSFDGVHPRISKERPLHQKGKNIRAWGSLKVHDPRDNRTEKNN